MKLAEALTLRADYQKRIEQLKARLNRNAKVQEGERPAEDPGPMLQQLEQMTTDLVAMIQRINRTNSSVVLEQGMTLADALAVRDILQLRHGILRELAKAATVTQSVTTKSEVKFKSTVNVSDVQKQADDLAKQHRELDVRIQEANWRTELSD